VPFATIRPPLPSKLIRFAAALLEAGLLVTIGTILLDKAIHNPDSDGPDLPIWPGVRVLPILIVAGAYAVQRFVRPRKAAFVVAGALVGALGASLRAGIEPLERLRDGGAGLVAGAIMTGLMMSVDDEAATLLEGGAQPWRELFMAALLVTIGAMPAVILGGFVLAVPTIVAGIVILLRCIRYDAPVVVPQRSVGAVARVFIAMLLGLLAMGFLVVTPLLSLGMLRKH